MFGVWCGMSLNEDTEPAELDADMLSPRWCVKLNAFEAVEEDEASKGVGSLLPVMVDVDVSPAAAGMSFPRDRSSPF